MKLGDLGRDGMTRKGDREAFTKFWEAAGRGRDTEEVWGWKAEAVSRMS